MELRSEVNTLNKINEELQYKQKEFSKISEEKNIIIVSPTSSGKTESFLFPILNLNPLTYL